MDDPLAQLARAMDALRASEQARERAWAFATVLDPEAAREVRLEAEQEVVEARDALRAARARLGHIAPREKAWSGH